MDPLSKETGHGQKRVQPDEIIGKLRRADILLGQGQTVPEIVTVPGIPEATDYC